MSNPFDPQNYYNTLTGLYTKLFGRNWHLGYWLHAATFAEAGARLNAVMIDHLRGLDGRHTVVDVGCGVGGPTCDLAEATGARVIGVTNSKPGVSNAAAWAAERGLSDRVSFEFGEAQQLPLGNASVDGVFSCEAIHNVVDKASLAREFGRVLKSGGQMVVGDLFLLRPASRLTIDVEKLKGFSFHLFEANEWIDLLRNEGIRVNESVNAGHHVGEQSLTHCTDVCLKQAASAAAGTLEHVILTRTAEATTLLAQGFLSGDLGWGIWRAVRD